MSELPPIPRPQPRERLPLPPIPRAGERLPSPLLTGLAADQEVRRIGLQAAENIVGLGESPSTAETPIESRYEGLSDDFLERELDRLLSKRSELSAEKRKVEYAAGATHNSEKIESDRDRNWQIGEELKTLGQKIAAIQRARGGTQDSAA